MGVECPRCGESGYVVVHKKGYIYVIHRNRENNRACYIGPLKGYKQVARLYNIDIGYSYSFKNKIKMLESLLRDITRTCADEEGGGKCTKEHILMIIGILDQNIKKLKRLL